jgi:3-methylcrotonyl-CoA carboxylase alpha subunit/acetyl-CoA/propionyl-CoA carboxylase biotin carboxyl carrier protein
VPVVASYALDDDPAGFTYPVLVKAAAGGGGKGMRVAVSADELAPAVEAARREAQSSFGDDTLLIERYVEHGKHIEVQILADHYGNVVHLFERDCSAQRRHQKVIEEAPAVGISDTARTTLRDSAVALAREVGYTNAGTVEFLVVGDEVLFLEMNTRLQVEHPVTEAITGLDLVALQIRIAAGESLPFTQDDLRCSGHAFEARVYAEDAWGGFLPQAGVARDVRWPEDARVDAALESGQQVGTAYDPMLGKIIVHAPTRSAALGKLIDALDATVIIGLTTNTGFLRALAASSEFRDNAIDTAWLDHHEVDRPSADVARQLAAWAVADAARVDATPFGAGDGWRSAADPSPVRVQLDDEFVTATSPRLADYSPAIRVTDDAVDVVFQGQWFHLSRSLSGDSATLAAAHGTIIAPMPGTLLRVEVAVGDRVSAGDVLGVLEAMKMELPLKAPTSGTVTHVGAAAGDQVPLKHTLFTVELDG